MTLRPTFAILAALLTLSLTGCSRSEEEPAPVETRTDRVVPAREERSQVAPDVPVQSATATSTVDANLAAAEAPAVAQAPDEQMLDDASASGMTARAPRGETPANDAGAADPSEEK